MARAPTRRISAPSPIQPVASPVDAYVRPAEPARSSLHDLANGLSALDSGLSSFLGKRQAAQKDLDKIRGEAAFNRANQVGWAEAVKQGLVPANASPTFMEAYKKSQGNLAGLQLRDRFNLEYQTWEGRNSDDPNAFQGFLGDFLSRNVSGVDDPYVLEGLNPHVQQLYSDGYSTFSTERGNAAYKGAVSTQGAIASETIQGHETYGISSETGTDYEGMWGDLMTEREAALGSGIRKEDYDKTLIETIVAEAKRTGNTELLMLLDKPLPGEEFAISSYPEYKKLRDQAIESIESSSRQAEIDGDRRQKKIDEARKNSIMVGISRTLAADPNAEIPESVIQELERYDPGARKAIFDTRKAVLDADEVEDPAILLELQERIRMGATEDDVLRWMRDGEIRSPKTFTSMLDRVEKYREARASGSGILNSSRYKSISTAIKDRTTPDDILSADPFGARGMSDEGLQATHDYEMMLLEWEMQNPDATMVEREKAIFDIGQTILERIDRTDPGAPDYVTPQEGEQRQAAARQAEAEEQQRVLLGDANPWAGDQAPDISTLPEEQRNWIENEARRLDVTPEEYNEAMWSKIQKMVNRAQGAEEGLPTEATPFAPTEGGDAFEDFINSVDPETTGSIPTSAVNPQVARNAAILDLIGSTEGTDKRRGYDETLAYGKLTGGDKELTKMTLDQIDQLQTQMLRHPENKWNSSALGRYQIIRTTLRGLREELGLSGDTLFDKDLQDRLAVHLLERRGLSKWMNGQMSDEAFMKGLANEWASLPTASGLGAYAGQRVGTTAAGLRDVLAQLKQNPATSSTVPVAYAKIPQREVAQFMEWNPDPIGNHEANLASIKPQLGDVVKRAQELAGVKFVVGSGKRDQALQDKAVQWGWSKTRDSNHLHGDAVDIWIVEDDGSVSFDAKKLTEVAKAMKQAAKELGVGIQWGGDWTSFVDRPHFELT
jgi:muramidase (phage lysozyme)/uncharacterized protein YcbK (DUF882 family)